MTRFLQNSVRILDNFSLRCGRAVSWLVLILALATLAVAIPRYLLNNSWFMSLNLLGLDWESLRNLYNHNVNAMNDSTQYIHAIIFMVGVSYAMKLGDHVRIDIFYRNMSMRTRAWVDLLGVLLFMYPMFLFIFFMSWDYVLNSWSILETSQRPGGLELVYLLKTFILIMPVLMLLQGTSLLFRKILELKGQPIPEEQIEEKE
jgi:TRAP-type mannitol/chloroaromatic compound transport system permease small subunit